jgi:hypothetical protein
MTLYQVITSSKNDPFPTIEDFFGNETEALDTLLEHVAIFYEDVGEDEIIWDLVHEGGFGRGRNRFFSIQKISFDVDIFTAEQSQREGRDPRMKVAKNSPRPKPAFAKGLDPSWPKVGMTVSLRFCMGGYYTIEEIKDDMALLMDVTGEIDQGDWVDLENLIWVGAE